MKTLAIAFLIFGYAILHCVLLTRDAEPQIHGSRQETVSKSAEQDNLSRKLKSYSERFELHYLRETTLPVGETEVRIWVGFGLFTPRCIVFNDTNKGFETTYLTLSSEDEVGKVNKETLVPKRMELLKFREFILNHAVLRMNLHPDKLHMADPDQEIIVVEIRSASDYKLAYYAVSSKSQDGKVVRDFLKVIENEFCRSIILDSAVACRM